MPDSDVWNGWTQQGSTTNAVVNTGDGFITCSSPDTNGSMLDFAISAVGGDELEFEVMALLVSGTAYAVLSRSNPAQCLSSVPILDTYWHPVWMKSKVPASYGVITCHFSVGVPSAALDPTGGGAAGVVKFTNPIVRRNGAPIIQGYTKNGWRFNAAGLLTGRGADTDLFTLDGANNLFEFLSGTGVVLGGTALLADTTGTRPFQIQGLTSSTTGAFFNRWSADAAQSVFVFGKSRGGAIGTFAAVQTDDILGEIRWVGSDPAAWYKAADITVKASVGAAFGTTFAITKTRSSNGDLRQQMLLDDSENVLFSTGNVVADSSNTRKFNVYGNPSGGYFLRLSADAQACVVTIGKSRGSAAGTFATVVNHDLLGQVRFTGDTGTAYYQSADITSVAELGTSFGGRLDLHVTNRDTGAVNLAARISDYGDFQVGAGGGDLATSATAGFLFVPACAGAPTGVPSQALSGSAPIIVDDTNKRVWVYVASAWVALRREEIVTSVVSSTYTSSDPYNDEIMFVNNAGAVTITPPTSPRTGVRKTIKDISGVAHTNSITWAGTTDGASSFIIASDYGSVSLKWNGSSWSAV